MTDSGDKLKETRSATIPCSTNEPASPALSAKNANDKNKPGQDSQPQMEDMDADQTANVGSPLPDPVASDATESQQLRSTSNSQGDLLAGSGPGDEARQSKGRDHSAADVCHVENSAHNDSQRVTDTLDSAPLTPKPSNRTTPSNPAPIDMDSVQRRLNVRKYQPSEPTRVLTRSKTSPKRVQAQDTSSVGSHPSARLREHEDSKKTGGPHSEDAKGSAKPVVKLTASDKGKGKASVAETNMSALLRTKDRPNPSLSLRTPGLCILDPQSFKQHFPPSNLNKEAPESTILKFSSFPPPQSTTFTAAALPLHSSVTVPAAGQSRTEIVVSGPRLLPGKYQVQGQKCTTQTTTQRSVENAFSLLDSDPSLNTHRLLPATEVKKYMQSLPQYDHYDKTDPVNFRHAYPTELAYCRANVVTRRMSPKSFPQRQNTNSIQPNQPRTAPSCDIAQVDPTATKDVAMDSASDAEAVTQCDAEKDEPKGVLLDTHADEDTMMHTNTDEDPQEEYELDTTDGEESDNEEESPGIDDIPNKMGAVDWPKSEDTEESQVETISKKEEENQIKEEREDEFGSEDESGEENSEDEEDATTREQSDEDAESDSVDVIEVKKELMPIEDKEDRAEKNRKGRAASENQHEDEDDDDDEFFEAAALKDDFYEIESPKDESRKRKRVERNPLTATAPS